MMRVKHYFGFIVIALLMAHWCRGQQHVKFERIAADKGIYQSIVYCIAQDSFGNIWMGTEEGVIRFNSEESFFYDNYHGLPPNFGNRISAIHIDQKDHIWIGAESGIALFDPKSDIFQQILPDATGDGPNLVQTIIENADGHIFIGGFNGIWRYDPTKKREEKVFTRISEKRKIESLYWHKDELFIGNTEGLFVWKSDKIEPVSFESSNAPTVLNIEKQGDSFLLGTKAAGLWKFSPSDRNAQKVPLDPLEEKAFPIHKIQGLENGNLYLATDGLGLLYLSPQLKILDVFTNDVNATNAISSNGVYDLLLGKEGILWITTYGGGINLLSPFKNEFQTIAHQINTSNSIRHSFTRSILEDQEGNIWFGTKEGISIWNRKEDRWKHLLNLSSSREENATFIIMALEEDGDYIWAGTYGDGAYKIHKKTFATIHYGENSTAEHSLGLSKIYAVRKDQSGRIWMGGIDGNLQRINTDGSISSFNCPNVKSILVVTDGSVFVGGRTGVQRIIGDSVIQIEQLSASNSGLDFITINCLYEPSPGTIIVGTNGAGLAFYNLATQTLQTLSRDDGMPSDIVQGILSEDAQNLWVSTTRGLAHIKINTQDTLIEVFNQSDGLVSTEFNYGSFTKLKTGQMIFGGVAGLTFFDPTAIGYQTSLPKVYFEEFRLFNRKVEVGEAPLFEHLNVINQLRLKYTENAITIKFAGILHSVPSKVNYSWRLDGFNDEWSEASTENQTNFTNLEPGNYTFRVKAANRDGAWGPERQLAIYVAPPWWATTWAYIGYVIIGLLLLGGLIYLATVLINKHNAEQQIAFFNNITHELKTPLTILLSTLDTLPNEKSATSESSQKVRSTVNRLNALFDQLLNFHRVTSNRFQRGDIAKLALKEHVEALSTRFGPLLKDRDLSIRINDEWPKGVFYYEQNAFDKILFNLLSNAIKYSRDGQEIVIDLQQGRKTDLKISIHDKGIGIPKDQQKYILKRYYRGRNAINSQQPGTGLGLMMVKNLIEKDGGSIDFKSEENEGTTFILTLKSQQAGYRKSALVSGTEKEMANIYEHTRIEEFSDAKILIVEDNDELRKVLVKKIGTYFQVFEASNGREGLEKVGQLFPDLILTDLIMPEMDGMAMCQALQQDINLNHIPIFMLTVLNNSVQKLESIENGITEYMEKPIDLNLLLAKMTNTLAWQAKLRKKYLHEVEVENAEKFRNKRDADFINNLEKFVVEQLRNEGFSVHDLCKFVGMSRTSLYMKLKNLVDLSPQDFIIHTRLRYARKLLREDDMHIKEVAYQCGFTNPKYFSTAFKKYFGSSPSDYLKSLESND